MILSEAPDIQAIYKYVSCDCHKYTRNLIFENEDFALVCLCWGPKQSSTIHDHPESDCWLTVVNGSLKETQFPLPSSSFTKPMVACAQDSLKKGDIAYLRDELNVVHSIGNESEDVFAVSLHVYAPPLHHCNVYCPETGKCNSVCMSYREGASVGRSEEDVRRLLKA